MLKVKYKLRSRALGRSISWRSGHERKEAQVLEVLQDLIVGKLPPSNNYCMLNLLTLMLSESYANVPMGHKAKETSKNILALRNYVQRSNILDKVLSCLYRDPTFNPALKTLQAVLTHLQFDLSLRLPTLGFSYSQKAVYGHPNKFPMFRGQNYNKVNIDFIMHTANFFKYHMTMKDAQTLYEVYSELEDHEKPKAWSSRIHQGPGVEKLGKRWKGSYGELPLIRPLFTVCQKANRLFYLIAYLDEQNDMRRIRTTAPATRGPIFTDAIDFHDGLQTLELDFSRAANIAPWPKVFESHLKALPPASLCKKLDQLVKPDPRPNVTSFLHLGQAIGPETTLETPPNTPGAPVRQDITFPIPDIDVPLTAPLTPPPKSPKHGVHYLKFSGSGTDAEPYHCNGILHPLPPQHEIPGWHRITLMKYFAPPVQEAVSPSSPSSSGTTSPYGLSTSPGSKSSASSASSVEWPYPVEKPGSFTPVNTRPRIDYDDLDVNNGCWAYEGVVLPGGKIILGRWWSPIQDSDEMLCMGPFIFWEVDEA